MKKLVALFALMIGVSASAQTEWTEKSAGKWMKKGKYLQGLNAKPHESTNAIEFASQYEKNKELWDKAFKWLNDSNIYTVAKGKYIIEENKCWVVVQEYYPRTADKQNIEQHQNTIDLQYTLSGNEKMGVAPSDSEVIRPYNPKKDVAHFKSDNVKYYKTDPKKFFLFFPCDLHQPSVTDGDSVMSRKIVVKMNYVK